MANRVVTYELECLNCSRSLGEVAQVDGGGAWRLVRRGTGGLVPRLAGGRLRCGRCGGSVMMADVVELAAAS